MTIEEIITLKGEKAEEIIGDYFFDFEKINSDGKKLSLREAARKSGKDYKLLAVLWAINRLPTKNKI
jgi:hypothetical protein